MHAAIAYQDPARVDAVIQQLDAAPAWARTVPDVFDATPIERSFPADADPACTHAKAALLATLQPLDPSDPQAWRNLGWPEDAANELANIQARIDCVEPAAPIGEPKPATAARPRLASLHSVYAVPVANLPAPVGAPPGGVPQAARTAAQELKLLGRTAHPTTQPVSDADLIALRGSLGSAQIETRNALHKAAADAAATNRAGLRNRIAAGIPAREEPGAGPRRISALRTAAPWWHLSTPTRFALIALALAVLAYAPK